MRTIQIINCKWYNATFWYALYLTKILNEHGHESILVTIPNSLGIQKLEELGIDYTELPLNSFHLRIFMLRIGDFQNFAGNLDLISSTVTVGKRFIFFLS